MSDKTLVVIELDELVKLKNRITSLEGEVDSTKKYYYSLVDESKGLEEKIRLLYSRMQYFEKRFKAVKLRSGTTPDLKQNIAYEIVISEFSKNADRELFAEELDKQIKCCREQFALRTGLPETSVDNIRYIDKAFILWRDDY